jgi:hypothetical protein
VADMGGLGKKIAVELQERTGIPIEAAEKDQKLAHIELLNDALRTGRLYAQQDGRFAQDCLKVEWDRSNPEKPKISSRFHSDICDAVLYAFMKSQAWLHQPEKPKPATRGTVEWYEAQQKQAIQELEEGFEAGLQQNKQKQQEEREAEQWQ